MDLDFSNVESLNAKEPITFDERSKDGKTHRWWEVRPTGEFIFLGHSVGFCPGLHEAMMEVLRKAQAEDKARAETQNQIGED